MSPQLIDQFALTYFYLFMVFVIFPGALVCCNRSSTRAGTAVLHAGVSSVSRRCPARGSAHYKLSEFVFLLLVVGPWQEGRLYLSAGRQPGSCLSYTGWSLDFYRPCPVALKSPSPDVQRNACAQRSGWGPRRTEVWAQRGEHRGHTFPESLGTRDRRVSLAGCQRGEEPLPHSQRGKLELFYVLF